MRAKVTKAFHGWDEQKPEPGDFKKGDEIEGNIAHQAVTAGFATWITPPTTGEAEAMRGGPKPRYPVREIADAKSAKAEAEAKAKAEAEAKAKAEGSGALV